MSEKETEEQEDIEAEQESGEESGEIIQFGEEEIIEQTEEQEEDLEEEAVAYPNEFDADNFSQFIGERTAPLLEINNSLEQIPDTLENTAETAPTTSTTTENQPGLYATSNATVIGEPDYLGSQKYENIREKEQKSRTMREHGVLGAIDEAEAHQRRMEGGSQTGWGSELQGLQQQSSKYEQVMNAALEQESRRMPFERRKMKERRL